MIRPFDALALAFALVMILILAASRGEAQAGNAPCSTYERIAEQMRETHGEEPRFRGLMSGGQEMIELWLSSETGTWTVIVARPNGIACVPATGGAGLILDATPAGEPG